MILLLLNDSVADLSVSLSGASCAANPGSLAPQDAIVISGAVATVSAGSIRPSLSVALTGSAALVAAGTLKPSVALTLTGAIAAALSGSVSISATIQVTNAPVNGAQASVLAGSLIPLMMTENLIGDEAVAQAGALPTSVSLTGAQADTAAGTVSTLYAGLASLVGASVQALAGQVSVLIGQVRVRFLDVHGAMPPSEFNEITLGNPVT
jgi:hypothetical protein